MERYIVMANDGHIEPIILLSKSDLMSALELEKGFRKSARLISAQTLLHSVTGLVTDHSKSNRLSKREKHIVC
jgi:ribosome biogenesis GTPase